MASMEPRLFSRGYLPKGSKIIKKPFASMEPRLFSRGYRCIVRFIAVVIGLQWSHGFSAVDTERATITIRGAKMGFNGATAFQPWIPGKQIDFYLEKDSFNGATAFQPWIRTKCPCIFLKV